MKIVVKKFRVSNWTLSKGIDINPDRTNAVKIWSNTEIENELEWVLDDFAGSGYVIKSVTVTPVTIDRSTGTGGHDTVDLYYTIVMDKIVGEGRI